MPTASPRAKKLLPLALRPRALVRMLLDPKAPKLARALMIASLIYLVWPFDLLPDLIPLIGYLDDLGVVGLATAYLLKSLERYETTKRLAAGERIMDP